MSSIKLDAQAVSVIVQFAAEFASRALARREQNPGATDDEIINTLRNEVIQSSDNLIDQGINESGGGLK